MGDFRFAFSRFPPFFFVNAVVKRGNGDPVLAPEMPGDAVAASADPAAAVSGADLCRGRLPESGRLSCRENREKTAKIHFTPLTNPCRCCKMDFHTVGVCVFLPFPHHGYCSTGSGACQDGKSAILTTDPGVSSRQHMIPASGRKKGCDDPYGNGQGRTVRQDHA